MKADWFQIVMPIILLSTFFWMLWGMYWEDRDKRTARNVANLQWVGILANDGPLTVSEVIDNMARKNRYYAKREGLIPTGPKGWVTP